MGYHYEKPAIYLSKYGKIYTCSHPVYNKCTLFTIEEKGLSMIQQRFDPETKNHLVGLNRSLVNRHSILHPRFKEFFDNRAGECVNGLYPTVTIRQIMWALKIEPIPRELWETFFDRRNIKLREVYMLPYENQ